jgi:type I restriction enzyme R subunit
MTRFTESTVEEAALAWLEGLSYAVNDGPEIAPGAPFAEREDYGQVVFERRLRQALQRLNPEAPPDAIDEAFRRLTRPDSPSLAANNHAIHRYLVEGVPVEYQRADGSLRGDLIRVLDHADPDNNEFLAVNQFTVVEDRRERRPDVVLFVNGLPLAVIELKTPADERVYARHGSDDNFDLVFGQDGGQALGRFGARGVDGARVDFEHLAIEK